MVCFDDTRCCTVSRQDSQPALPAAWAGGLADLVEAIEDPMFPSILSRSLGSLIHFDRCTQIVYIGETKPIPIGRDVRNGPPETAGRQDGRYRLHPFYPIYRSGVNSGTYLLQDLVELGRPDIEAGPFGGRRAAPGEPDGPVGGMTGADSELCIVLPIAGGGCVMVSLTRGRDGTGFTDDDVARANLVLPFLTSVFRRYWQSVGAQAHRQDGNADRKLLQQIGRLSPREKEIVGLLIDGHSTLSISLRLDISGTTVKTHRKNLYSKLGVGTLYELFSLYGDSIKHRMAHSY